MADLSKQVAIITGGGSGIGRAITETFASNGAVVHILDSNVDAATSLSSQLRSQKRTAFGHQCDISSQSEVSKTCQEIAREGRIDILVNNAGIAHVGKLEQTSDADMDRVFRVNVKGAYNCMHACVSHMKQQGKGVILNIASIAGMIGLADRFTYSMSKGAILAMTYSVAKDYLAFNIRCNSISPARIHTPFVDGYLQKNYPDNSKEMFEKLSRAQPIGRMGEPKDVAALALFLCSDDASFVTGVNFPLDGGTLNLSVPG
jgi:NAD(P)-dependent dehydrogenase (short-subunit alcohol dehydrogenase family)